MVATNFGSVRDQLAYFCVRFRRLLASWSRGDPELVATRRLSLISIDYREWFVAEMGQRPTEDSASPLYSTTFRGSVTVRGRPVPRCLAIRRGG